MSSFNMEDPAKQEAIRRQPHEYIPTAGKHGAYVPKPYVHQDYPKMMAKHKKPELADFKGQPNANDLLQLALVEWDRAMTASIVHSKAQEQAWLKENA